MLRLPLLAIGLLAALPAWADEPSSVTVLRGSSVPPPPVVQQVVVQQSIVVPQYVPIEPFYVFPLLDFHVKHHGK